ncbi:hypothetical protein WJX77_003873 [Trebouxia sp. C0004]
MAFQQLGKAETMSPIESEHAPFVILLGWVNCDHRYLAKYSELLSKNGYSSLRTIQPTFTGFSIAEAPRRLWASNILNYLLERQKVQHRSLVFWQFSNGGCWVFEQIVALVQAQGRYVPIKNAMAGLIFDSAPCVMTITSGRAAITEGTRFPIKQLLQAAFLVMTLLTFVLVGNTSKRFWNRMLKETLAIPRLYFYSTDDKLCDVKELETLLDMKRQQGLDVTVKRWDKSAHCAHLRKHPDEYIAEVQAFLAKVSKP